MPWLVLTAGQGRIFALATMPLPRLLAVPGWPLLAAAWWVMLEAVRGRAPLGGFPWGRLAFSQTDAPYAGWAAVGGGPALSFVVALPGALLVYGATVWRGGRRRLATGGCVGAAALVVAPLLIPMVGTSGSSAVITVVQGNVERERTLEEQARVRGVAQNHARETKPWQTPYAAATCHARTSCCGRRTPSTAIPGGIPSSASWSPSRSRNWTAPCSSVPSWKPPATGPTTPASCGCPVRARSPGTPSASSSPSASTSQHARSSAASVRSSSSPVIFCRAPRRTRCRRAGTARRRHLLRDRV